MVNAKISLGHDLLDVPIRERVSQVPANAQQNDHVFEVPPAEKCCPFSGDATPYQISSNAFATEPLCCPFLTIELSAAGNQADWTLTLSGAEGVKALIAEEFPAR
jgi:hypothetical protein